MGPRCHLVSVCVIAFVQYNICGSVLVTSIVCYKSEVCYGRRFDAGS